MIDGTNHESTSATIRSDASGSQLVKIQQRRLPMVVRPASYVVDAGPGKRFTLTLNEDGYGPSDHSSFYAKQIPVLFFWTGTHADYHKPSDTAEKINYEGEARIASFVANIVRDLDKSDKRPTYTVAKVQSTGTLDRVPCLSRHDSELRRLE